MITVSMSVLYVASNAVEDPGRSLNNMFLVRKRISEIVFQSEFGS
jgi:hypothetical protein